MFKELSKQVGEILSSAENHHAKIESELHKLHEKLSKRIDEKERVKAALPRLKKVHQGYVKSFGYSENDLAKDDAIKAKKDIVEAVKKYVDLEQSIKEIKASIAELEKALFEEIEGIEG